MRAIIIDDEDVPRNSLQRDLQRYCAAVELIGVYDSPTKGIEAIKTLEPDIVFLDVEMPREMSGFEMLDVLGFPNINFDVVFCTAHEHYARQAFKYAAVDFLTKPIDKEELIAAVMRAQSEIIKKFRQERYNLLKNSFNNDSKTVRLKRIALQTAEGFIFVESSEVVRFEAQGAYTFIHLKGGKKTMVSQTLKNYEDLGMPFFKVHRSHIVNLHHVTKYFAKDKEIETTGGALVPVARQRNDEFLDVIKDFDI